MTVNHEVAGSIPARIVKIRSYNSVGQSAVLITQKSRVQVPSEPSIINNISSLDYYYNHDEIK